MMNNNMNNTANRKEDTAEACIGQGTMQTSQGAVGQGGQIPNLGGAWFVADPTSIMGQMGIPAGSVGGVPVFIHPANNGAPAQVVGMGWGSAPVSQPRETIVLPSADGLVPAQPGGQPVVIDPRASFDAAGSGMGLGGSSRPNLGDQQANMGNTAMAAAPVPMPQPSVYDAALQLAFRRVQAQAGGNYSQAPQAPPVGNPAASGVQGSGTGGTPGRTDHGGAKGSRVVAGGGPGNAGGVPVSSGQGTGSKAGAPPLAAGGEDGGPPPGCGSAGGLLRVSHPLLKYANGTARRPQASDGRQPPKERRKRKAVQRAKAGRPKKARVEKLVDGKMPGSLRVVPAQTQKPGERAEVGEALVAKANHAKGLAAGAPTAQAGSGLQQGSAPHPDLSTQGDSFPPSVPSNPAGPSTTPSEAQPVDSNKEKGGEEEKVGGGVTKGNDSGRRGGKRKPRTYTHAVPSQHCHICSRRPAPDLPHFVCGNLLRARCRKTICMKCFEFYKWDAEAVRNAEPGTWLCNHCRDECPPRSQCVIYNRTSARRRLKLIKHRKKKTANGSNPNGSAATTKKSAQATVAASASQPPALPVAAVGNTAVQCAQADPNQGMATAGPSNGRLESLPRNEGQPATGKPQTRKAKAKRTTKRRRNEGQTSKPSKKARAEERVVLATSKKEFVAQMQKHGGDVREMVRHSRGVRQGSLEQGPPAIPQRNMTSLVGNTNTNQVPRNMEQITAHPPSLLQGPMVPPVGNGNINPTARNMEQHITNPPSVPQATATLPVRNQSINPTPYNMEQRMAHPPSVPERPVDLPARNPTAHPTLRNMEQRIVHPPSLPQGTGTVPVGNRNIDPAIRRMVQGLTFPPSFLPHGIVPMPCGNPMTRPTPRNVQQIMAHTPSVRQGPVGDQVPDPIAHDAGLGVAHIPSVPEGSMAQPVGNQAVDSITRSVQQSAARPPAMPQRNTVLPMRYPFPDPPEVNARRGVANSHAAPQVNVVLPMGNPLTNPTEVDVQQALANPTTAARDIVVLPVENATIGPPLGNMHMRQTVAHPPTVPQRSVVLPVGNQTIDPTQGNMQQSIASPLTVPQGNVVQPVGNESIDPAHGNMQQSVAQPPTVSQGNVVQPAGNQTMDPAHGNMTQSVARPVQGGAALPVEDRTIDLSQYRMQQRVAHPPATSQGNAALPVGNNTIDAAEGNTQQSVARVAQVSTEMANMQTASNHVVVDVEDVPSCTPASAAPHFPGEVDAGNTHASQEDSICLRLDEAIAAAVRDERDAQQAQQRGSQVGEGNFSNTPKSAPIETAGICMSLPMLESLEQDCQSGGAEKQVNPSRTATIEKGNDESEDKRAKKVDATTADVDETTARERSEVEALVDSFLADDLQQVPPLLGTSEAGAMEDDEDVGMVDAREYGDLRLAFHEALEIPEPPVDDVGDDFIQESREQGDLLGASGEQLNASDFDFDVGASSLSALDGL